MTRKDYQLIANVLSHVRTHGGDRGTLAHVVTCLREPLTQDNPRFDFDRFAEACGFDFTEEL